MSQVNKNPEKSSKNMSKTEKRKPRIPKVTSTKKVPRRPPPEPVPATKQDIDKIYTLILSRAMGFDVIDGIRVQFTGVGSRIESERRRDLVSKMRKEYSTISTREFLKLKDVISIYMFE